MDPSYRNPFGVAGVDTALDVAGAVASVVLALAIAGGLASLALRLRRAGGVERRQVKLLLYAATLSVAALVGFNMAFARQMELSLLLGNVVWGTAVTGLSLAVTVAIVRHRLFDIDRLISRTLAYAALSVLLVAMYVGIAVVPAAVFAVESDLLVAAATLAAAAVFRPLRRRVQAVVDHRFNRARYDAARTVDRFAVRLRDATDLAVLHRDLATVVHETVQPTHLSLWFARGGRRR